jgi:hypothetical protein
MDLTQDSRKVLRLSSEQTSGNAHHRPFPDRWEYAPLAVLMAKKKQCNGTRRRQRLDAYVASTLRWPVPELKNPNPSRGIRSKPMLDHQPQRVIRACH